MTWTSKDHRAYRAAGSYHDRVWLDHDGALYDLCKKFPAHDHLPGVVAKVGLIARTYASGLERGIKQGGGGNGIEVVATRLHQSRKAVDRELARLRRMRSPGKRLDAEILSTIVEVHGHLTSLIKRGRVRRRPHSFVSKYLHFHCKAVPIYDSRASWSIALRRRGRGRTKDRIAWTNEMDEVYWHFCNQFLALWEDAAPEGSARSVRRLDSFLLWI